MAAILEKKTGTDGSMAKKILCIDDEPGVVEYLEDIFQDHGYETVRAYDGRQGLSTAKSEKPDLITLDLDMSSEWGTRFYRNLRKDPELKAIPVVVISGLSSNKYAVQEAAAVINKPFEPEQVLRVVWDILGRN